MHDRCLPNLVLLLFHRQPVWPFCARMITFASSSLMRGLQQDPTADALKHVAVWTVRQTTSSSTASKDSERGYCRR